MRIGSWIIAGVVIVVLIFGSLPACSRGPTYEEIEEIKEQIAEERRIYEITYQMTDLEGSDIRYYLGEGGQFLATLYGKLYRGSCVFDDDSGQFVKHSDYGFGDMYIVWNEKIFSGAGKGEVVWFDQDGNSGVIDTGLDDRIVGFGIFQNKLYCGTMNGKVGVSEDGENWSLDTQLDGKWITLAEMDGHLYAFQPYQAKQHPIKIFRKHGTTGAWAEWKTYDWTLANGTQDDGIGILWEVQQNAQKDIIENKLYLSNHSGSAFIFDTEKCLKFFEWQGFPRKSATLSPPVLVKIQNIMGLIFIAVGYGDGSEAYGELWTWNGLQLCRHLTIPVGILSVAFHEGHIWLTSRRGLWTFLESSPYVVMSDDHKDAIHSYVDAYNAPGGCAYQLPIDILNHREYPPLRRTVWKDKAISRSATVSSDDDGGVMIPCLGYGKKTIYIKDTKAATLTVEVDVDGHGNWETFDTVSLKADTVKRICIEEGMCFLRLKVAQGADAGTLNASVLLEPYLGEVTSEEGLPSSP